MIRSVVGPNHYYGVKYGAPSASTISRTLRWSDITRKVLQRIHYLRSPALRAAYMARVAPVHYIRLVDVDETTSTQKEFLQRYGYAPRCQVAVKTQLISTGGPSLPNALTLPSFYDC
jgi:hypothetical protein